MTEVKVKVPGITAWKLHDPIPTLYRNGNRSHPDHLLDYVLISRRFRSDTRLYRSVYLQSDHEIFVSTLCFKIKAKRCQPKRGPQHQIQSLPSDVKSLFRSAAFDNFHAESSDVNLTWNSFKEALQHATKSLPEPPRKVEAGWVTDEMKNRNEMLG